MDCGLHAFHYTPWPVQCNTLQHAGAMQRKTLTYALVLTLALLLSAAGKTVQHALGGHEVDLARSSSPNDITGIDVAGDRAVGGDLLRGLVVLQGPDVAGDVVGVEVRARPARARACRDRRGRR